MSNMTRLTDMCMDVVRRRMAGMPMPMSMGRGKSEHKELTVDELSDVMACFWKEVAEGERDVPESMVTGICAMVNAMLDARMEHEHTEYDAEAHRRYKEAIENIREAPNMQEKERLMKEYFGDDLTADEMVVLRDKATSKSYKQKAREKWGSNGTAERWMDATKSLKHKFKLKLA